MAANVQDISQVTQDERSALSGMITRLFDAWNLTVPDRASLLGLSVRSRSALAGYRRHAPMARNQDLLNRASYLLGIHKSLRLMFPQNRDLAYAWPTTANKRLDGMTPVEFMKDKGLPGLAVIRTILDIERGR